MRTALSSLELLRPASLEQALRMLHEQGPLTPLAGGTDIYVNLQFGTARETRYIDLSRLNALRGIDRSGDILRIGALATYTEISHSPDVARVSPILQSAAREIGGIQIQNRATLGGNIANGSPAGDTLPVLAVADAILVLASVTGESRVPFNSFYTGYRKSVLRPDELIIAVEISAVEGRQYFRKVGTRAAQAISKLVFAGIKSEPPRIALGSVAPTVIRLPRTEAALASGDLPAAQRALGEEISPIDDLRSTAAYRKQVATNLLARFWNDA